MRAALATCAWLLLCLQAHAFYLPGVAPQDYEKVRHVAGGACLPGQRRRSSATGAQVQAQKIPSLKMNKLSSSKTQLPYEYYSLPYCRPEKVISSAENLGEVLRGDRIVNSRYQVRSVTSWPEKASGVT